MKRILRFLRSLQLSLVLLILLVPIIAAGNLIPQEGRVPPAEILEWDRTYPVLSAAAGWFSLHHLYTSWWFLVVFTLLCLNLSIVTWELIGRTAKKAKGLHRFDPDASSYPAFYSLAELPSRAGSAAALEKVLSARGYRLVAGDGELYARKGWVGIWGGTVMHIGFVAILAGAIVSGLTRFSGYTEMGAGQYHSLGKDVYIGSNAGPLFSGHQPEISIRIDNVAETDSGFMKVVVSDVSIMDHGRIAASKTIRMNEPLAYAGMTLYQSKYTGPALLFEIRGAGPDTPAGGYVNMLPGKAQSAVFRMQGTPFQAEVVYSEGSDKADLELRRDKALIFKGPMSPGQTVEADGRSIVLVAIKRWSGIIVVYDSGTAIVFFGFFLSVLGVAIMGLFDPREIWVRKSGLVLGWARWRNLFLEEFESIMKECEEWKA